MQGQDISLCAISSGGGYAESATGSISMTFGQVIFQPAEDPTGILTQGFQQPGCNPAGTACDDGDPCTINDVEDGVCGCAGVTPPNTDPIADAGGPYTILLGDDLQLDGTASSDPDNACGGSIVSWEWDVNNNGSYTDATGDSPLVTWSTLNNAGVSAPGNYTIGIRVTDDQGATHTATATLTIIDGAVPTLGTWGLIILGLLFLCAGAIVIWKREYELQLQTM